MASEFDNEMDFLLRQTAQQAALAPSNAAENHPLSFPESPSNNHLDADDLAAFAENALPQLARSSFVSHLADCNLCREILSNLILLNETAQEEELTVSESEKTVVAVKPSWLDSFKKLFAFPTLGFASAALAVLLIGSFAFVALRRTQENLSASVAKLEPEQTEEALSKKRTSAPPPAAVRDEENEPKAEVPVETPNASTAETLPESTPTPDEKESDNLPPSVRVIKGINRNSALSDAASRNEVSANSSNQNAAANVPLPKQTTQPTAGAGLAAAKPQASESSIVQSPALKPEDKAKEDLLARSSKVNKDEPAKTDDSSDDLREAPPSPSARRAATAPGRNAEKQNIVETRTVSGKTFQKIGGVWFDSAYNTQNPKNVSRGSDEYKKLDAGLRSIAENLSGEIIIVWQNKAYLIR